MWQMIAAFLILCWVSAVSASYKPTTLFYDVSWGNISLAKSQLDYEFGKDDVRISASVASKGIIAFFRGFKSRSTAELVRKDTGWAPKKLSMERISGSEVVKSNVIWGDAATIVSENRTPELDLTEVYPLDDQMRVNVIDPYSAVFRLLDQIENSGDCTSSYEIYDGRRRSRIYFEMIGDTVLEQDRPGVFTGSAMVCGVKFDLIGGHRINSKWRSNKNPKGWIKIFFARPLEGYIVPVRIEMKSRIGKIIGRLDLRQMQVGSNRLVGGRRAGCRYFSLSLFSQCLLHDIG